VTVQANDRRKEYPGNAVTTVFDGPRAIAPGHIKVYLEDSITKVSTLQNSGYTLAGVGKAKTTITFALAPLATKTVIILNDIPYTQDCDISNQSRYLPEVLEESGLDPLEMQIQKLADRIARTLLGSDTNSAGNWNFDAQGRRIINLAAGVEPTDATNLDQLLKTVEQAITGGPTYGVAPKLWQIHGDGVNTDFPLDGADVYDSVFYEVVLAGLCKEPFDEYIILPPADAVTPAAIRFPVAPANGVEGFVILRGYSRPWSGPPPVATLRIPIADVPGPVTLTRTSEFSLLRCTAASSCALTVRANIGDTNDWQTGSYFSVTQRGTGQAQLVAPAGVTLVVPAGFAPFTRAPNSTISAVCEFADTNTWIVSGDLAGA